MPVRRFVPEKDGIWFITFTCIKWLPLIRQTGAYDIVYKWFDYLKLKGHYIVGYVIMPNHLHLLIAFRNTGKKINTHISNGKRFIAYEIIKRLKKQNDVITLQTLSESVVESDACRGKLHQVFKRSFDWKECSSERFVLQKLNYIHINPCKGVWMLADSPVNYPHSSAKFYETGEQGIYPVTGYKLLEDVDLTK